jgi:acyl-homoserine-lactone acylase
MMKNSPLKPSPERPYLFNGFVNLEERHDNPLHQRAAMCVELLHNAKNMTVEDAIEIAMSPAVYGADAWQERLRKAWSAASADARTDAELEKLYTLIVHWSRRCEPENTGAIAYLYWKQGFGNDVKLADRAGMPPPAAVTDEMLIEKLKAAAERLKKDFGRFDVAYGEVYRVGRKGSNHSWPVGGGSVPQIATPRAISFDPIEGQKQFLGKGGQTSTQVVLLTNPPKSWTVLPLGESDHPDSPHYDDQAHRLFSKGTMKPTHFLDKAALVRSSESKTVIYRDVN